MSEMTSSATDVNQLGTVKEFISYYQQEIGRNISLIRNALEKSQDAQSDSRGFDAIVNAGHAIGDLAMVYGFETEEAVGRRIARAAGGDLDKSELTDLLVKLESAIASVTESDVTAVPDAGPGPETASAEPHRPVSEPADGSAGADAESMQAFESQAPELSGEREPEIAAEPSEAPAETLAQAPPEGEIRGDGDEHVSGETEGAVLPPGEAEQQQAGDSGRASALFPELRDHLQDVDEDADVEPPQALPGSHEAEDGRDRLLFDIREDEDLILSLQNRREERGSKDGGSDPAGAVGEQDVRSETPSDNSDVPEHDEQTGVDPEEWDISDPEDTAILPFQDEEEEPPLLKRIGGFFGRKK